MSVQPSLNNSNTVVAEIINEINSTQPSGNYSQNTRSTPIQPQMQQQMQQQRTTTTATTRTTTTAYSTTNDFTKSYTYSKTNATVTQPQQKKAHL